MTHSSPRLPPDCFCLPRSVVIRTIISGRLSAREFGLSQRRLPFQKFDVHAPRVCCTASEG